MEYSGLNAPINPRDYIIKLIKYIIIQIGQYPETNSH